MTGTVTLVEWMNPHARFHVDVEEAGKVVKYDFELGSPNGLMRRGWRRDSLLSGDVVIVAGWRARNDPHVADARTVKLADGTELFAGSSADNGGVAAVPACDAIHWIFASAYSEQIESREDEHDRRTR